MSVQIKIELPWKYIKYNEDRQYSDTEAYEKWVDITMQKTGRQKGY